MIAETILLAYLTIAFLVAHYVLKAYNEDEGEAKNVMPKWMWFIVISFTALCWPIPLMIYIFKGK